ncbi:MAG: tRNA (cytidine(34)-2'-O)-methyltransferase [Candidatus Eremiobacteraeota bacterium]|nr:tRNA (cytidine(34)-2'-O)-methyltransferase [Candidatus Eremiobacteraeota bacterium]
MRQTQPSASLATIHDVRSAPLHIALVEPQIPPNTGNVARLCAATGCALHLIEPLGFSIDDRSLKRAGLDYWDHLHVIVHPSFADFMNATYSIPKWFFSTRASRLYHEVDVTLGEMLVFGKETAGLPSALLTQYHERTLRIPMREDAVRSLNLSTSVGIVTYAALAQLNFPNLQ